MKSGGCISWQTHFSPVCFPHCEGHIVFNVHMAKMFLELGTFPCVLKLGVAYMSKQAHWLPGTILVSCKRVTLWPCDRKRQSSVQGA